MDEVVEKRTAEQSLDQGSSDGKRRTDEVRSASIVSRNEEEILASASSTTVNLSCPPEKVGPLIGKKGIVVQEIMRRSSCRIYVDQNFPEGHPRQIQLTGHPRDLAIAIALVTLVMEHGPSIVTSTLPNARDSPREASQDTVDTDFLCPPTKVGALIGPKGSNVHEIFRRTGCRVQVLQDGVPDGVDRRVSFSGSAQQIAEAKALVSTLIGGGSLNEGFGHSNTGSLGESATSGLPFGVKISESDIDPEKVRLVIGAKGVTIGEIMKRSGCKVFINQNFPEGQPHKVVYTGTPQQIDMAKYLVDTIVFSGMSALYSLLNGVDSIVIQEMSVFTAQALRLADALNDIQARCGVRLNVDSGTPGPVAGTCRVSIIGKLDSVHSAIKLICQVSGSMAEGSDLVGMDSVASLVGGPPLVVSPGPILALGKDGSAGHLESAITLQDGSVQQVAEVKNDMMGRVVGSRSANISLIKAKSGANVHVLKSDNAKGTTRILLSGSTQSVSLAAQMVQEVLVNGLTKLLKMNDAVSVVGIQPGNKVQPMESGEYYSHQPYYGVSPAVAIYPAAAMQAQQQASYNQHQAARKGYN